jgi:intein/homing endonuclease
VNFDLKKLKKSKEVALFLGMFAGDGCLTIKHNGDGYRIYPVQFFNTRKDYVELFAKLFYNIFGVKGTIFANRRENRKVLWGFRKYSVMIYKIINTDLEISCGKKALTVRIPSFIRNGPKTLKKAFFLGLLITDGGTRSNKELMFHSASKELIYDLRDLIESVWGVHRNIKEYIQREKFRSYQLTLNTRDGSRILNDLPTWHNLVLR